MYMKLDLTYRFNRILLSSVVLLSVLHGNAYAQRAGQPASNARAAYRLTMTECEGIDNCTTWTFLSSNGWKGYGKWRTGEEAILELTSPDTGKVVIHRTDVRGAKEGLIATYNGTLSDGQMGGSYTYSYNGENGSGRWYAILGASAPKLPAVMHFCDVNCITLRLENGRYVSRSTDAFVDPDYSDTWTVESFTHEAVVFQRTVTGMFHFRVTYRGQISDDGNSLINATNPFHGEGQPTNIILAWGDALNSVPGSNAERDRARGSQQTPSRQITAGDVYEGARAARDFVLEIKRWGELWDLLSGSGSN
jgi:hypothetical protein